MLRNVPGNVGVAVLVLLGWAWSVAVYAQSVPPPVRPKIDANGIELVSVTTTMATTDLVIGQPGAGGLMFGRATDSHVATELYFSGNVTTINHSTSKTFIVSIDNSVDRTIERFSKQNSPSNAPYVNLEGTASTLTKSGTTFTYTNPAGLKAVYNSFPGRTSSLLTSLTLPDGEIRTYHYVSNAQPLTRLQSVTNNRGYQVKLIYADIAGTWGPLSSAKGVNMAVDYCDPLANVCTGLTQSWPTVTYNMDWGTGEYSVTDASGATTVYYP